MRQTGNDNTLADGTSSAADFPAVQTIYIQRGMDIFVTWLPTPGELLHPAKTGAQRKRNAPV